MKFFLTKKAKYDYIKKSRKERDEELKKHESNERRKLFSKIIKNYYKWLILKTCRIVGREEAKDATQDAILFFYEYHIDHFDLRYNKGDLERRAKNYFFQRYFWYFNNYYGKKLKDEIKRDQENQDDSFNSLHKSKIFYSQNYYTNRVYGGTGNDINSSGYIFKHNNSLENRFMINLNNIYAKELEIYLDQFKSFILKMNIQKRLKQRLVLFLCTLDKSVFKTNEYYYMEKLKEIAKQFNVLQSNN